MTQQKYAKDYYSLTEMLKLNLVHLKQKQLSVRFNKLLKSGKLIYGVNLYRDGPSWQLHTSTFHLFSYRYIGILYPFDENDIIDIVLTNRIALTDLEEKQSKK